MRILAIICAAAIFVINNPQYSYANDCDGVLIPNVDDISADYSLTLSYLRLIDQDAFRKRKSKADGRVKGSVGIELIDAMVDSSASYEEFAERRDTYLSLESYDLSEDNSRHYLKTYLSDAQVNAWVKCKAEIRTVSAHARNATDTSFTLRVDWAPPNGVTGPQTFSIDVSDGGTIRGSTYIEESWSGGRSVSYPVAVDPGSTPRVIVNIAGHTDDLIVISKSKKRKFSGYTGARFAVSSGPYGDCYERSMTILDEKRNTTFSVDIIAASADYHNCLWVDWTGDNDQVGMSVARAIGLVGGIQDHALLSHSGDCGERLFTLMNTGDFSIKTVKLRNNCSILDFTSGPATTARMLCKHASC